MSLIAPLTGGKVKLRDAKRDALLYAARAYAAPGTRAAREAALAALLDAALEYDEAEAEVETRFRDRRGKARAVTA